MDNLPLGPLLGVMALTLLWSALFTAVEAAQHHLAAQRPNSRAGDRPRLEVALQSLVLSKTLCNVVTVVLGTLLAMHLSGDRGPWLAGLGATCVILIFAEYLPRLLALRHPHAFISLGNALLKPLFALIYPLAWPLEGIAKALLRPFAVKAGPIQQGSEDTTGKLLNELANDARAHKPQLPSGIHALDKITVNDILVPRSEIDGVNLDDPIEQIIEQLIISRHTRLPVFHSDINQVEAVLNTRQISHLLPKGELTMAQLMAACYDPYFVPESTPLQLQLLNFHKQQRRLGVVVDEYGEVQGIVTLEDILEEIVGEFEDEHSLDNPHIHPQADGRFVIEGAISIRELNKSLGWHLPCDGPKTLNGLVTEALESIPETTVCLKIGRYRLEILETEDNRVSRVLIWQTNAMSRPAGRR
ncbi:CNNM domain-containing protein [Pseudomonas sp. LS1212]|uniref:HlyC/CorC family transporter n=1 Tax=Pseudomonas sp. LS1212 TaxID=2972478 RepID=UPI00215BB6A7|nr:transporter associated domain-containing protein [Pseudomonas sp. LS1212]UVJ45052.1 CNNM domain-containing protein [Pseudomonas sp. LS1212]